MFFLLKTLLFIDVLMAAGLLLFRWALAPGWRGVVSGKIAALALVTPAVALFCGNIYLFCLYLTIVVAFNARSRAELAGTYLFMLPLMPSLTVETGVGGIYILAVSTVAAMGLGALIGFLATGSRRVPVLPRYDLAMWALVGLFVFIVNHDPSPTNVLRGVVINLVAFAGPYLLVSRAARTPADLQRVLLRLVLGGVVLAVTACFQARRHWVVFETYYSALHVNIALGSASMAMRGGLLRTGGSMVDYSTGGLFLAVVVTVLPLVRPCFRPAGYWAVMAVLAGGLFVTQSRGAWVAAIVGLLVVAAWRGRWGQVALLAGGAGLAQAGVLASGTLASMVDADDKSGTGDYRHQLAVRGLEQVRAHPLFGQAPDQLVANMTDLMQGQHIVDFVNGHLFVAMAAGVPLFLVWCAVWLMPLIEGWRRRGGDAALAAVPAAMIVPSLVALTFTSIIDRNLTWPTLALALAPACYTLARRRPAAARAEPAGNGGSAGRPSTLVRHRVPAVASLPRGLSLVQGPRWGELP